MSPDLAQLRTTLEGLLGPDAVAAGPAAAPWAVDGCVPALAVAPGTQEEVAAVVAACAQAGAAFVPWGGGTAMGMGNPPARLEVVVRLERLDRVSEYDAANLCIAVEAGMPLARLQALVAADRLVLPLDPPAGDRVTLGGLVAANQSGPSRHYHGTARDWVLGLRVVLPDGQPIRCGGRVIKNVTGYDMNKLFIRSCGTLGIVTEVTLKLLPMPEAAATVLGRVPDFEAASQTLEALAASFLLPEAVDLLEPEAARALAPALDLEPGGWLLAVAFAGSQAVVDRQVKDFQSMVSAAGGRPRACRGPEAQAAWERVRSVLEPRGTGPRVVVQVAVPIGQAPALLETVRFRAAHGDLRVQATAHAGSGLIRAELTPGRPGTDAEAHVHLAEEAQALRGEAVAAGGSMVVLEAPPAVKARLDAWGPAGSGFSVMRRIKDAYDPRGLCSPGRFVGGI